MKKRKWYFHLRGQVYANGSIGPVDIEELRHWLEEARKAPKWVCRIITPKKKRREKSNQELNFLIGRATLH